MYDMSSTEDAINKKCINILLNLLIIVEFQSYGCRSLSDSLDYLIIEKPYISAWIASPGMLLLFGHIIVVIPCRFLE